MDNIPDYLRIGVPTLRRQKTVDEIQCEMREKISVLEKDNRDLIEVKVKRETELFQLRERLESLEKLYNEIREEKLQPSREINEENGDKKKPSQSSDLDATKSKLDRISKTLQKIKNRQQSLKQPTKINL